MKLKYKKIDRKPFNSYLARRDTLPCLEDHWHFHEEFELIYFLKSKGIRYVGNSVDNFEENEIYLIGSNLPHLFRNKKDFYEEKKDSIVDMIIIHFNPDFLFEGFNRLPEARNLFKLLERSSGGLMFSPVTASLLHNYFVGLVNNHKLSGLINLLRILDLLSISHDYKTICSKGIVNTYRKNEQERMSKIINFIADNYDRNLSLGEIAGVASMTPNAFCRFFKKKTLKSFSQYLNEIRIGNACKLLIEDKMNISEVSYASGFNSVSNFNRKFKAVMGVTPSEYLRRYESSVDLPVHSCN